MHYTEVAKQAGELIADIIADAGLEGEADFAIKLGHLYNLGIRTAPRGVQHTVRQRAVTEALKNQPVKVGMEEKEGTNGLGNKYTYNAIKLETKDIRTDPIA